METETAEPGLRENGTMAEMASGTGMKISVARDELVAKLGVVSRAVSTRGTVQVLSGILLRTDGEGADPCRDRHGVVAADDARRPGRRRRRRGHPRQTARRARAPAPRERCHDRVPARGGHGADRLRLVQLAPARLQRRGLPAAADRRRPVALDRPRGVARDRGSCRALRLARRVAPRADRDPRPFRGWEARHGRNRLLPALGQGDRARRRRARARGDHPGSRADRAVAAGRRRHGRARRAREPCRLRHRCRR